MLERADDPKERISLLQQAIEICRGKVYKQSMWADFEWRTHQLVEQGEPVTAESLRELYYEVNHDYVGDAVVLDDYYRSYWTRLSQFYRSPFYVYKYATSYAASAKLFREITSDDKDTRQDALDRYLALLRSGGNDYPVELLKKAGVDLSQRETIQAVVDHFDDMVTRLETELAKL
jgi:oligoendopeptidase F